MKERYVYRIDKDDRIKFVNSAWLKFARENEAPELTKTFVIGKRIWIFIAESDVQKLYRSIFTRVRTTDIELNIPFRCDLPTTLIFMELSLHSLPDSSIELSGKVLKRKKRKYTPLFDRNIPRSNQMLNICSFCRRIRKITDEWLEPEQAIIHFNLFNDPKPPQLIESICPLCNTLLSDPFFKIDFSN